MKISSLKFLLPQYRKVNSLGVQHEYNIYVRSTYIYNIDIIPIPCIFLRHLRLSIKSFSYFLNFLFPNTNLLYLPYLNTLHSKNVSLSDILPISPRLLRAFRYSLFDASNHVCTSTYNSYLDRSRYTPMTTNVFGTCLLYTSFVYVDYSEMYALNIDV